MSTDRIADLSTVSPQRTFIESHPKKPAATSTLYISRFATENAAGGQHHTIVGVHIVLAEGDPNGLWNAFHIDRGAQTLNAATQKKDDGKFLMATRSLTICCDTLEVRGEFSLPEADVTIHARRLVWATPNAAINTSPLSWDLPNAPNAAGTTPGQNGANGRSAGSLRVFVGVVEGPGDSRPRFVAQGGHGQDQGQGSDGANGRNMPAYSQHTWRSQDSWLKKLNTLKVKFSPPAVYVDASWWGPAHVLPGPKQPIGSASFPTNGANAVAPGIPGNGGNGGELITNQTTGLVSVENQGGAAGATARNRKGGAAGSPQNSAMYTLYIYLQPFSVTNNPPHELKQKSPPTKTTKGSDAAAKPASRGAGSTPRPVTIDCANAWLHPLGLHAVLEYARDAYLGGDCDGVHALLAGYEEGLAQRVPKSTEAWNSPWDAVLPAQWTAAQAEVASMLQRLRAHLDYFGNAAGYTPLLSLPGSIKLYEGETRRTLRTMLLADWVRDETRKAEDAAAVFGDLIDSAIEDSARAAEQVTAAEKTIDDLVRKLDGLERQLQDRGTELAELRTKLLAQAETTEQEKANIRFSIKMAGAICQVIPVGQPALGAVGSLAGVGADLIGGDPEGVPDTISRMGDVITKSREAARKAEEAGKKAGKAKGDAAKDADSARKGASAMGTALDGLGPAMTQASGAIAALQVPRAEVEAELARLEAECPELQDLLREIGDINDTKTGLFGNLGPAFQSLSDGYSRLSSNAAAIVSMQEQKGRQLGRIDHEASLFVELMGQRSRLALLRYLYFMVKAYETATLQTLDDVDWELTRVTEKINALLKDGKGFDTLEEKAGTLDGLFQDNLNVVRKKLLEDASRFSEVTMQRTLVLAGSQSPEEIAALNDFGRVVLDPFAHGLVDPGTQLARLSDADLESVEFDPDGPQLPDGTQLIVDLIPAREGTLRRAESLCAVYSEAPVRWNWTYSRGGPPDKSLPSKSAEDLLDFILGAGSDRIRQKIASPPFWSRLVIQVRYLPGLDETAAPRITMLNFGLSTDVTPAPDSQHVLVVHPVGPAAGTIVECAPEDLAGRGPGVGHFMRIFDRGADVRLDIPAFPAGASFDHWQLIGTGQPDVAEPEVSGIKLKKDVIANAHWVHSHERIASFLLSPEDLTVPADLHADDKLALRMDERVSAGRLTAGGPDAGGLIRVEPRDDASIVGAVPPGVEPDQLRLGEDGWREVNYRGVAGWVRP